MKRKRRARRSETAKLVAAGLGALGALWAVAYLLQAFARPAAGPNVEVIPPGEPLNLRLNEVRT